MFNAILATALLLTGQATENEIKDATVKISFVVYEHPIQKGKILKYQHEHYGSGTIVNKKDDCFYILSCAHNLKHKDVYQSQVYVYHANSKYFAQVLKYDLDKDLSLLRVNAPTKAKVMQIVEQEKEDYKLNEEVFKSGFPRGEDYLLTKGKISMKIEEEDKTPLLTVDFTSIPGESGGGIYRNGRLIGVLFGNFTLNPGQVVVTTATRHPQISQFLEKAYE